MSERERNNTERERNGEIYSEKTERETERESRKKSERVNDSERGREK